MPASITMEHVTPTGGDQPTIQEMFATLLGEIATLRRQNEDQQRQLEHLRNTTSRFLERNDVSLQTSSKLQFKHLPVEIREMVWELAIPSRLLGFPGSEYGVPSTLSIPAIAHVCRESRRVFTARKQYTEGYRNYSPPHLWRLKDGSTAHWSSFRPHTDALLINPGDFLRGDCDPNYAITLVAEHIVVESATALARFNGSRFEPRDEKALTNWIGELAMFPKFCPPIKGSPSLNEAPISTRAPVCHLRTVDFVMGDVTIVDHNYPPNLVHRLFAGNCVKIVDLRDRKAVHTIQEMIEHDVCLAIQAEEHTLLPTDIEDSLLIFKETATEAFPYIKKKLLRTLVRAYYNKSEYGGKVAKKYLPAPFRDGKWDMEVTWVKELCKRIDVRPVHVFVRAEGMSEVDW